MRRSRPPRLRRASSSSASRSASWSCRGRRRLDASYHLVFRSEREGDRGELVGITPTNRYTDATVLTTIPYFYTVVAVSAGGSGAASAQLETEAVTVLQRQAEYLDRAPSAVADRRRACSWRGDSSAPIRTARRSTSTATASASPARRSRTRRTSSTRTAPRHPATSSRRCWTASRRPRRMSSPCARPPTCRCRSTSRLPAYTKDGQPYTYSANDTSVGDVDGDGQYELFVKWDPSNSKDNSQAGYTGNVYLDAYRLDGTRLWRIDLGVNIRAGAHYTQFQVYDFDGDGRAEVTLKTGDGTIDGVGQPIGNAGADYRNSSRLRPDRPRVPHGVRRLHGRRDRHGRLRAGPRRRRAVGRHLRQPRRPVPRRDVAYLDGEHPSVIFSRGYYTRAVMAAYDFDGTELTQRWVLDSNDEGNEGFYGQGNHNLSVADVDGDGKDEIVYGSATVDDDGDAALLDGPRPRRRAPRVGSRPLDRRPRGVRGARGDARLGQPQVRRCAMPRPARSCGTSRPRSTPGAQPAGDIDPRHEGAEGWAIGGDAAWNSPVGQLKSSTGELISTGIPAANFLAWFDGDPLREIVDHYVERDHLARARRPCRSGTGRRRRRRSSCSDTGARTNNRTKGTPNLQADLFGDWREEIAWRARRFERAADLLDHGRDRSAHPHADARPRYRLSVAWQNTGYNQPPQPSFFLGDGMELPAAPRIAVTGAPTGPTDATAPVDRGSSGRRHPAARQRLAHAGDHGGRPRVGRPQPRRRVRRGAGRTRCQRSTLDGQGRAAHADRARREPRRARRDSIRHGPRVRR